MKWVGLRMVGMRIAEICTCYPRGDLGMQEMGDAAFPNVTCDAARFSLCCVPQALVTCTLFAVDLCAFNVSQQDRCSTHLWSLESMLVS